MKNSFKNRFVFYSKRQKDDDIHNDEEEEEELEDEKEDIKNIMETTKTLSDILFYS